MSQVPELVKKNEMYRWGYNDGLMAGIKCVLIVVAIVAIVAALVQS